MAPKGYTLQPLLPAWPTRTPATWALRRQRPPCLPHSLTPSLSCARAHGCGRRRRPPRKHSATPPGPERVRAGTERAGNTRTWDPVTLRRRHGEKGHL